MVHTPRSHRGPLRMAVIGLSADGRPFSPFFFQTPEPDFSAGMHDLNSGYDTWFNRRHRRAGALSQGRFKAILVEEWCWQIGDVHPAGQNDEARAAALYVMRKLTGMPATQLAQRYGGVSHAAILKTVRRAENRREEECRWSQRLSRLENPLHFGRCYLCDARRCSRMPLIKSQVKTYPHLGFPTPACSSPMALLPRRQTTTWSHLGFRRDQEL